MAVLDRPSPEMWRRNLVVGGVGVGKYFRSQPSTLSLKTVLRGEACFRSGGRPYLLNPDLVLILDHGESYTIEVDRKVLAETFGVFFHPGFVESHAAPFSELAWDSGRVAGRRIAPRLFPNDPEIARLVHALKRAEGSPAVSALEVETLYHRLARTLLDERERAASEGSLLNARSSVRAELMARLAVARDRLLQDPAADWTLETIASTACLSAFHFHRLFVTAYGTTPAAFLTDLRIRRAARLFAGTDLTVAQVAQTVGFSTAASLHRLYKRQFGRSPRGHKNADSEPVGSESA